MVKKKKNWHPKVEPTVNVNFSSFSNDNVTAQKIKQEEWNKRWKRFETGKYTKENQKGRTRHAPIALYSYSKVKVQVWPTKSS